MLLLRFVCLSCFDIYTIIKQNISCAYEEKKTNEEEPANNNKKQEQLNRLNMRNKKNCNSFIFFQTLKNIFINTILHLRKKKY